MYVISIFEIFYFKILKRFNLQICTPSNVPYTATKAATIFKYALLAALSISTIAVAFFISEVTVSKSPKLAFLTILRVGFF